MIMKKFINKPEDIAKELTEGLVQTYSNYLKLVNSDIILHAKPKEKGKVQIV
jgi:dihydroxyacetone kinase